MTGFAPESLPDLERRPEGETRGTVLILAGQSETAADHALLIDQLLLAGFAVTLFSDVSIDAGASRRGVARLLADEPQARPVVLVGTDFGAILALDVALDRRLRLDLAGIVIGGLVTPSSRPSTISAADFEGMDQADGAGSGALDTHTTLEPRIPPGFRLPAAADVRVPVLVFHGDADDVTGVADAVSWASVLPFGSLRLVPGGDHHVVSGEARRTVAAATLLFIERQRAGRPVLVDGFAPTSSRAT